MKHGHINCKKCNHSFNFETIFDSVKCINCGLATDVREFPALEVDSASQASPQDDEEIKIALHKELVDLGAAWLSKVNLDLLTLEDLRDIEKSIKNKSEEEQAQSAKDSNISEGDNHAIDIRD